MPRAPVRFRGKNTRTTRTYSTSHTSRDVQGWEQQLELSPELAQRLTHRTLLRTTAARISDGRVSLLICGEWNAVKSLVIPFLFSRVLRMFVSSRVSTVGVCGWLLLELPTSHHLSCDLPLVRSSHNILVRSIVRRTKYFEVLKYTDLIYLNSNLFLMN